MQAMAKTNDARCPRVSGGGPVGGVGPLEPKEAARVSADAAATLMQAMAKTNDTLPSCL